MIGTKSSSRFVRVAVAAPVLVLALAACGGGSSGSASSTATPATSSTAAAGGRGGFGGADFQAIQSCLTAAGISLPTPSGRPSGMPTGAPGGGNGTPPAGAPNGTPPTGGFGGNGGGGMRELFTDSKVKAALKACNITVPTGGARPRPTATSS